jgi:phytoene dehydrogenase-like protein
LPLHASMTTHYFDGAYYPRGGAKRIPAAYIRALRRARGSIVLSKPVTRIIVERGRAVGIETKGGETFHAGQIVCNADPAVTYGRLIPPEHCPSEMRKLRRTEYSVGMVSLFVAVEMDLRRMGFDSGNYWFYRHERVGEIYEQIGRELPQKEVDGLFLTVTSLKDPGHAAPGIHTIEMFTFVPYQAFEAWSNSETGARPPGYESLKTRLSIMMLDAAERVIPGLRGHIRFLSVGSPLTNDFYCRTYRGAIYGTAKTPWQVGPFSFSPRGPIEGLHFAGASILSHGVAGASLSGLTAAQHVLGLPRADVLIGPGDGSLRLYPADSPETWIRHAERIEDAA